MTIHQNFPPFDPLAQQHIAERVRAHAAYAVAHRAETGTVEGMSDADG